MHIFDFVKTREIRLSDGLSNGIILPEPFPTLQELTALITPFKSIKFAKTKKGKVTRSILKEPAQVSYITLYFVHLRLYLDYLAHQNADWQALVFRRVQTTGEDFKTITYVKYEENVTAREQIFCKLEHKKASLSMSPLFCKNLYNDFHEVYTDLDYETLQKKNLDFRKYLSLQTW